MTKITLSNIASFQNDATAVANYNANNATLTTAMDNTLSRDGTAPNTMGATIDMNSNQIVNLPAPVGADAPLRLRDLSSFVGGGTVTNLPPGGTTGQNLSKTSNADYAVGWSASGTGTVTSVGLALPSDFSVTNSPVTSTGTLTGAWNTKTANTILSGPASAGPSVPTFRTLVAADIPTTNLAGDVGGTTAATAIGANKVTNAMLATAVDFTIKSNIAGSTTAPSDNTITAVLDKQLGTTQGSVMYRNATVWTPLTPGTAGQFLSSGGPAANVSWAAASGSGTVTSITPGNGLTSTLTAGAPGSAVTTTGTLSVAETTNAQSGTTYAIVDTDRGKLITAVNAAAQAYSIAQAGNASAFQTGWYTDIINKSTNVLGIVTVTPATSTINGAATLKIQPGQSVRIISDGVNYQVFSLVYGGQLPGTTTNDAGNVGCVGEAIVSNVANPGSSLTTNVALNVTSISLTAGDWDVQGVIGITGAGTTTVGQVQTSISQTSATTDVGNGHGIVTWQNNVAVFANTALQQGIPTFRISLASTTTIYLVAQVTFGVSTCTAYGNISARRVR